jgi:hypothetical protein
MAGANLGTAARFGMAVGNAGPTGIAVAAGVIGLKMAFGALVSTVGTVISALQKMKTASLSQVQTLSKYNADLAAGNAQLQVGRQLREIAEAMALGKNGRRLMEAQNRLENAVAPFEKAWNSIKLDISLLFANFQADLAESLLSVVTDNKNTLLLVIDALQAAFPLVPFAGLLEKLIDRVDNKQQQANAWGEWKKVMIDAELDLMNRLKGPRPPGGA